MLIFSKCTDDLMKLIFYAVFLNSIIQCTTVGVSKVVYNENPVKLSLVNATEGDSVEVFTSIQQLSSIRILIEDIPAKSYFLLLQAHTYFQNVTLSYKPHPTSTESVTGSNVGLWQIVNGPSITFYLTYNGTLANTTVMFAVQSYGNITPIPGGCNMEEPLEVAPYLRTSINSAIINVRFSPAASPISVLTYMGIGDKESCYPLKPEDHQVYRLHLSKNDLTPSTYFHALWSLMTIERIKNKANFIRLKEGSHPSNRIFAFYPGTGTAFVVVARSAHAAAVYVPSFALGCDVLSANDNCGILTSAFSKIICAIVFFVGLFACFAAHRYFLIEMTLCGVFAGGIFVYALLPNYSDENLLLSLLAGFAFAAVVIFIWCITPIPLFSIFLSSCCLGFLVAGCIFVWLTDFTDLTSDMAFWSLYCLVILCHPACTVFLAEKANILAASVIGAFATVTPLDYYLSSNLRYIFLNTIRRTNSPEFKWATIDMPFQLYDCILATLWIILAISGFCVQSYLVRRLPPFPCSKLRRPVPSETTPLLRQYFQ